MNLKLQTVICWAIAIGLGCGSLERVSAAEETPQIWWMSGFEQRLDYSMGIRVETETRMATDESLFRRNELRSWLTCDYSPRHRFQIGYENSLTETSTGLEAGHDFLAAWDIRVPFSEWQLNSRQRMQYGYEGDMETGLFRHRIDFMWMESRLPFRLTPYAFDEWFFDFIEGEMRQNRVGLGLRYPVNDHVGLAVFGMRWDRWTPMGEHDVTPVVGFQAFIQF